MPPDELEARLARRFRDEGAARLADTADAPADDPPTAAVSVILAGPRLELALIRRAQDPRDAWSGHMALPGGRRDPVDVNLVATARRETLEEVGIDIAPGQLWGSLPTVAAMSGRALGFRVAPFLFRLPARPETRLNHEVAELIWVPLGDLAGESLVTTFEYERTGDVLSFPAWNIDGRVVWGLTHRVLSQLLDLPEPNVQRKIRP
jgi:8-oxo-dGTP pyrophosphatase MutT (NUDIX family)